MNVAAHWPKRGTTSAGDAIQSANVRQRAANQVPPAPFRGFGGKKKHLNQVYLYSTKHKQQARETERERTSKLFFLWLQGSSNPCPQPSFLFLTRDPRLMKETFDSCDPQRASRKKGTATRAVLGGEGWKLHPPKRDWQQPAHGGPRFFGGRARGLRLPVLWQQRGTAHNGSQK